MSIFYITAADKDSKSSSPSGPRNFPSIWRHSIGSFEFFWNAKIYETCPKLWWYICKYSLNKWNYWHLPPCLYSCMKLFSLHDMNLDDKILKPGRLDIDTFPHVPLNDGSQGTSLPTNLSAASTGGRSTGIGDVSLERSIGAVVSAETPKSSPLRGRKNYSKPGIYPPWNSYIT